MKVKLLTQGGWKTSHQDAAQKWLDESDQQFHALMLEHNSELTLEQIEEFKGLIDEALDEIDVKAAAYKQELIDDLKKTINEAMSENTEEEVDNTLQSKKAVTNRVSRRK